MVSFFKNPQLKAFTDINFVTRDINKDVKKIYQSKRVCGRYFSKMTVFHLNT